MEGDATRGRFEAQARDALAVAAALRGERVGLWGFSQGGWVAPWWRRFVVPGAEPDLRLPDGSLAPLYEQALVDWLS